MIMDEQVAIDRITETENLTDNLEDQAANWLIDWGISQAKQLVSNIKDEDLAGDKLNAVMAVMRSLNQIAGGYMDKPASALADDIRSFLTLYSNAFGAENTVTSKAIRDAARTIARQSPRETMQTLIDLAAPGPAAAHV
jgi:hypothetical protein